MPATDNVPEPLRGAINRMETHALKAKSDLHTVGADPETTWLRMIVAIKDEMTELYEATGAKITADYERIIRDARAATLSERSE